MIISVLNYMIFKMLLQSFKSLSIKILQINKLLISKHVKYI